MTMRGMDGNSFCKAGESRSGRSNPPPVTTGKRQLLPACNRSQVMLRSRRYRRPTLMRVLVVDDHKELAATLAVGLRREEWPSTSSSTARRLSATPSGGLRRDRARPRPCRSSTATRVPNPRQSRLTRARLDADGPPPRSRVASTGSASAQTITYRSRFAFAEVVARSAHWRGATTRAFRRRRQGDIRLDTAQRVQAGPAGGSSSARKS